MGTSGAWIVWRPIDAIAGSAGAESPPDAPPGWRQTSLPPDFAAIDEAAHEIAATATFWLLVAIFDSEFAYVEVHSGPHERRLVISPDLTSDTSEGEEALRRAALVSTAPGHTMSWDPELRGVRDPGEVLAKVAEGAVPPGDVETALTNVLEQLGLDGLTLSVDDQPAFEVGNPPGNDHPLTPRFTLRVAGEADDPVIELIDERAGVVMRTFPFSEMREAMSLESQLNGFRE